MTVTLFISVLKVCIMYIYYYYKLSSFNIFGLHLTWVKHFRSRLMHPINHSMCGVDFCCSRLDEFLLRDINTHPHAYTLHII